MATLTASLVIPCYNEVGNLPRLIVRCAEVCVAEPRIDVVLVDNGSKDATPELFAAGFPHARISSVRVPVNQGYGFGILFGLRAAQGEIIGWTHADMQSDPMDVIKALVEFDTVADVRRTYVKGRRLARPWRDVAFTYAMTTLASVVLRMPLRDINAQPNMFHRDFLASWENPPHDFALDLFVYVEALRQQFEVRRFPVNFGPRSAGIGNNERLSDKLRYSRRAILDIIRLRRRQGT